MSRGVGCVLDGSADYAGGVGVPSSDRERVRGLLPCLSPGRSCRITGAVDGPSRGQAATGSPAGEEFSGSLRVPIVRGAFTPPTDRVCLLLLRFCCVCWCCGYLYVAGVIESGMSSAMRCVRTCADRFRHHPSIIWSVLRAQSRSSHATFFHVVIQCAGIAISGQQASGSVRWILRWALVGCAAAGAMATLEVGTVVYLNYVGIRTSGTSV